MRQIHMNNWTIESTTEPSTYIFHHLVKFPCVLFYSNNAHENSLNNCKYDSILSRNRSKMTVARLSKNPL